MIDYRWSVFWATLDPAVGSEQAGRRPVLVVSAEEVNQSLPIITVLPMTSMGPSRRVYPTEVLLTRDVAQLDRDSLVLALEPPTTEVAGFLLHRPLPLLVLRGFHRRNFRQFLPYRLMLNPVYNTQSFF